MLWLTTASDDPDSRGIFLRAFRNVRFGHLLPHLRFAQRADGYAARLALVGKLVFKRSNLGVETGEAATQQRLALGKNVRRHFANPGESFWTARVSVFSASPNPLASAITSIGLTKKSATPRHMFGVP